MALSDELAKLKDLHERGALSDEEFARAKARALDASAGGTGEVPPPLAALNALRRSRVDRWLAGVCGGLARATGAEAWVWRLVFAALAFCGGAGIVIYLLLWIFVPAE